MSEKSQRFIATLHIMPDMPGHNRVLQDCPLFKEEVSFSFSSEKGVTCGAHYKEIILETEGGNWAFPFIEENYRFLRFLKELAPFNLEEKEKILGVFGDIGIVSVGNSHDLWIVDSDPAHCTFGKCELIVVQKLLDRLFSEV